MTRGRKKVKRGVLAASHRAAHMIVGAALADLREGKPVTLETEVASGFVFGLMVGAKVAITDIAAARRMVEALLPVDADAGDAGMAARSVESLLESLG